MWCVQELQDPPAATVRAERVGLFVCASLADIRWLVHLLARFRFGCDQRPRFSPIFTSDDRAAAHGNSVPRLISAVENINL